MKKLSLKKLSCLLLVLICAVTCVTLPAIDASAKVVKPSKVAISALSRYNKSTVGLRWKKASRAKGYQVYMKTNGGKFKKIKTTSGRYLKKSGLKINSSYYFKVRAYTKYKGKTYYGAFSNVRKIKMTSYVYLVDVMEPYVKYSSWAYTVYKGSSSFIMGGNRYYHGFVLGSNYGDDAFAIYNFNGKYSRISFVLGATGDSDSDREIVISCDDEIEKIISKKEHELPKQYSINVQDTYKFEINSNKPYWAGDLGFGNVRLYY